RAAAPEQPGHQLHEPVSEPRDVVPADDAREHRHSVSMETSRVDAPGFVGISVSDCAAARSLRTDARGAVAFLFGDRPACGLFIVLPAVAGSFCAVNLARYIDRRLF